MDTPDRPEPEDEPLTPEEEARIETIMRESRIAWEAEATRTYGPPDVRARKNRRYVGRLVRKCSESTIRGILKALSTLDHPMCCENLRNHDLDSEALEQIIRPFELMGLHFRILAISEPQFTVQIGEGYGNVGSGGQFLLERIEDRSFRILQMPRQWIA